MGKKALFLGGTGLISNAVTCLAAEKDWEVVLVNRGTRTDVLPEKVLKKVRVINLDINDDEALKKAVNGEKFDCVTQWIGFSPERVRRDFEIFGGSAGQYIFISSCAAYERPLRRYKVTEDLPLNNRFWQYGRDKAASEAECMNLYRLRGFPITIVRPSLTYGDTQIPFAMNSWQKPWSLVQRMLDGKEVVIHGDGTSLWSVTHNTDFAKGFAGLMGNAKAVGEAYHIVTDEVLTWEEILFEIAGAARVTPKPVYMSTRQIARFMPEMEGSIIGDKNTSYVFDCSKIKTLVPEFVCTTNFRDGIRKTIDNFIANPALQAVDVQWDAKIDALVAADKLVCPK